MIVLAAVAQDWRALEIVGLKGDGDIVLPAAKKLESFNIKKRKIKAKLENRGLEENDRLDLESELVMLEKQIERIQLRRPKINWIYIICM